MGKLLEGQLSKISELEGSGERKVGLVDRLGPFWTLSKEMTFQLRPEWRRRASHGRVRERTLQKGLKLRLS